MAATTSKKRMTYREKLEYDRNRDQTHDKTDIRTLDGPVKKLTDLAGDQ